MSRRVSLCGILVLSTFLLASAAEPSIHKVVDSTITGTVSFKPALQSFTDYTTGNLLIRDLHTGEVRVLVRAQAEEGADWSAITRDGQSVAYTWYASNGVTDLRVVGTDGSAPRVVLRDPEVEYVEPHDWTPDGTQILTHLVFRGWRTAIALVSVEHGSVRKLKSFEFRPWGRRMCVSPDGQFIAYDTPQAATTADRDIFLLRTDGTGEIRLVDHPANDIVLGWFSDGDLLFASNRSARWNAYRVAVSGTAPEKKPILVKEGLTPDLSQYGFERDQTYVRGLGFTSDGSFYYGFSDWENDAYLAELDAQGKVAKPPHKIADLLAFKSSVAWSPDGQKLALFTWHGWEPYSLLLRIRSIATGEERRLPMAMTRMLGNAIRPSWSPDGRYLVAAGGDGGSRRGIFRIDAETGETTPITVSTTCPPECVEWPVWLSDQQLAFTRAIRDDLNQLVRGIVTRDLLSGTERELYRAGSLSRLSHLAISPDRKSLAFLRWDDKQKTCAISILLLARGSLREIYQVKAPKLIFDLAWTADGKQIIFGTGIGGSFGTEMSGGMKFVAWRISTRGGKSQRLGLSMDSAELYGISAHPDGRRVAFAAGTPLRGELWRLEGLAEAAPQPPEADGSTAAQARSEPSPAEEGSGSLVSPRIAKLRRAIHAGEPGVVEQFWQEVAERGTPLVEPIAGSEKEVLVTFLWRGGEDTRNVVIFSAIATMYGFSRGDLAEHQLERIHGTDVWFKTYQLPTDVRFAYYLSPNDSLIPADQINGYAEWEQRAATWIPDPLNLNREVRPHSDKEWVVSLVELPNAPPKPWVGYQTQRRGRVEKWQFSEGGGSRNVWVYTPAGYHAEAAAYPLVVAFDGSDHAASQTAAVVDYLIAENLAQPVVVALLEQKDRWAELNGSEAGAAFLTKELVPWLGAKLNVTSDPRQTVLAGGSLGGLAAFFAALRHPDVFGNVISTSGAFSWPEYGWIMRQYAAAPKVPLRAYLDVGTFEVDMDTLLYANRHMRDVLLARGYEVHYAEFTGGHDSTHSDIGFAEGLKALLPKHAASSARTVDLQPVRLLTAEERYDDAEPAPSPDGKHVIFARVDVERKGRWRLWIVATSGGPPHPLTPPDFDWDCTRPSWSRDGQWIAFRASRAVNDSEHGGIWIMPASGGATRQLTGMSPAEDDYYPQWFPDGRQLAVLRDVPGTESDVWVVTLSGTASRLTTHPAFDGKSTISPDGRRIAFPSKRGGARDLWIMPVAEGEGAARQFTFDGGRGPAWSRDGRWIAYGCPVLPRGYALCLKRVEGGPVIQVTDGSGNDFNPEWGPDGTWIAVAQGDDDVFGRIAVVDVGAITSAVTRTARSGEILFDSERDGHEEVYVMDPDGSNQQRLTHASGKGGASWVPAWSPDRKRIAFASNREGNLEVYVMDADGSNVQRLTYTQSKESGNPAWSPDGKRIAFESNRDGNLDIYVMDTDGSNVHRLTHTKGRGKSSENPAWSPDGRRVAFNSNRDGHWEIYVIDADGSNAKRLTYTPGKSLGSEHAAWSPDGKRIAFDSTWSRISKNWLRTAEIYVMDADGSNVEKLSNATAMGRTSLTPVWSPDGKRIVFSSNRDGKSKKLRDNFEMYVMDADGSNVRRLTFNQKWDGHPDW